MSKKETENKKTAENKQPKEKKQRNFKKFKYGSASAVVMALVFAIVIVINIMVGIISNRRPLKLDLTPDKRYELSEESINAMKNLDKNVEITVTCSKDAFASMSTYFEQMYLQYYGITVEMPYDMIPELLDKYAVYAESGKGKISIRYVDTSKDPDVLAQFSQYYNGEIADGSMVFLSGERIKVLTNEDVIGMITTSQTSTQNNITMAFVGESTITSAIQSVTDANPVSVGVISSLNGNAIYESTYASVVMSIEDYLGKNGYDCTDIDAATNAMSTDEFDMIILPVPNIDFSADIIDKLGDFLYNGGNYGKNFIYIPHLQSTNLTNIDEFLADWKIQVEKSFILDENMIQAPVQALGVINSAPMLTIANADAVGAIANEALPIAAPYNRAITVLSKNSDSVVTEILKSQGTSYLQDLTGNGEMSEKGVFNAAVISKKETSSGLDTLSSNVLVLGSSFIFDSALITNSNTYNNASVLIGIINTMTGKEGVAAISEKALQQSTIAPTTTQMNVIKIIVIYAVPFVVALAGAIVLLRRKNR